MTKQIINIGRTANDRSGDPLRTAFEKVNANFTELYNSGGTSGITESSTNTFTHKTIDIAGANSNGNYFSIQGNNINSFAGSGTAVVLTQTPTIDRPSFLNNFSVYGGSSGTVAIIAQDVASGTLTLPNGNGTLATTDYVDNIAGGISITDFGEGFSLTGTGKIVTNKLYSTNETQPNQHYRFELDTNGVIHLPDQSIINGSYIRSVPGSYAGLTSGPTSELNEESWVWTDNDGVHIATQYSQEPKQWDFGNNGRLNLPMSTNENALIQSTYSIELLCGTHGLVLGTDGKLTLPGTGKISSQEQILASGASYTFNQDAYGSYDFVDSAFISIYQGSPNISSVQAGWILTTNNETQITIDHVIHNGLNYELHFSSDDSAVYNETSAFPITVGSPDYNVGQDGFIKLESGTHNITLSTDGQLKIENFWIQGYLKDVEGTTGSTGQVLTRASNGGVKWANATVVNTGNITFSGNTISNAEGNIIEITTTTSDNDLNIVKVDQYAVDLFAYNEVSHNYSELWLQNPLGGPSLAQIIVATNNVTKEWNFQADGRTIFPQTTVPSGSQGAEGDKLGMVAFDSSHMYYCKADYTDGLSDIWVRTVWGETNW